MRVELDAKGVFASIVAVLVFASLVLVIIYFAAVDAPGGGQLTQYSALQNQALANIDALVEKGLTLALGLIGALGAAVLGFNERLKLSRSDTIGLACTLYFCVLSVTAGIFVKIKLAEMMGGLTEPYFTDPIIDGPLSLQLYAMIAAIAALAWTIVYRSIGPKEQ
jgi:hypothetical protein